jgi:hypothetical protein
MLCIISLLLAIEVALATIPLFDPGEVLPAPLYAADNAIVPDYNVPFISDQPRALPGAYIFESNVTELEYVAYWTTANDTSVIIAANDAKLTLEYVKIVKLGYASNLLLSSFYGFNAAINIVSGRVPSFNPD